MSRAGVRSMTQPTISNRTLIQNMTSQGVPPDRRRMVAVSSGGIWAIVRRYPAAVAAPQTSSTIEVLLAACTRISGMWANRNSR